MQISTVATSRGKLAFAEHGKGEPLLLWPSLFTDHALYDEMARSLAGLGWQTIAIDGPGFGASTPPRGAVQLAEHAELVIELADRLQIKKFYFAGTSCGGQIGAHLGAAYPDRVSGLLLMNTPLKASHGRHIFELWMTRLLSNAVFAAKRVARNFLAVKTISKHPERLERFTARVASFDTRAARLRKFASTL